MAQYESVWAVKDSKTGVRPFDRDKLLVSLYKSCQHRSDALADARGLADTVIAKLGSQIQDGVLSTLAIRQTVQVALNRFDKVSSVHYQAFHK